MADVIYEGGRSVDRAAVRAMLAQKPQMKAFLSVCASCGLCAESCFLYRNDRDVRSMPSYKAVQSLGRMIRRKGQVDRAELMQMAKLIWGRCVLCRRYYCPLGIDIAGMIAWARSICRSQGVCERYDLHPMGSARE